MNASTYVCVHCFGSSLLVQCVHNQYFPQSCLPSAYTLSINNIYIAKTAALVCGWAQLELHPPSQADLVEWMLPTHGNDARLISKRNPDNKAFRQNIHALAKYNDGN